APKGSNDPFGLRRAAIHIVENLIANEQPFDLRKALQAAAELLPVSSNDEVKERALEFIAGRLESLLREQGLAASVVRAVLAEQAHDPCAAGQAARDLQAATEMEGWEAL